MGIIHFGNDSSLKNAFSVFHQEMAVSITTVFSVKDANQGSTLNPCSMFNIIYNFSGIFDFCFFDFLKFLYFQSFF